MDYSLIDGSSLLRYLFYPRKDYHKPPPGAFDLNIPVEAGVSITCRAYVGQPGNPWILFFNGNGEVVGDYNGIAPYYTRLGLNLLVADYRGYGASTGRPTFTALISDARAIVKAVWAELTAGGGKPHLWVMGRSLGSISALELILTGRELQCARLNG
ncbi:MAG: alpha/beta hydrolase [Bacillota bacterium]